MTTPDIPATTVDTSHTDDTDGSTLIRAHTPPPEATPPATVAAQAKEITPPPLPTQEDSKDEVKDQQQQEEEGSGMWSAVVCIGHVWSTLVMCGMTGWYLSR